MCTGVRITSIFISRHGVLYIYISQNLLIVRCNSPVDVVAVVSMPLMLLLFFRFRFESGDKESH